MFLWYLNYDLHSFVVVHNHTKLDLPVHTRLVDRRHQAEPEGGTDQVVATGYGGQGVAELALVQNSGGEIAHTGVLTLITHAGVVRNGERVNSRGG